MKNMTTSERRKLKRVPRKFDGLNTMAVISWKTLMTHLELYKLKVLL